MFQKTEVTFEDGEGNKEDGVDHGGLTTEMYACFFRELPYRYDLFERAAEDSEGILLPRADADPQDLTAFGRVLCKCVLDDHPVGLNMGGIMLEILVGVQDRRSFRSAESAVDALSPFDPLLAESWQKLLRSSGPFYGLKTTDFNSTLEEQDLSEENAPSAILSGVHQRLKRKRDRSWSAIRSGFTEHVDLRLQLAGFATDRLEYMVHGRAELSREDLMGCIVWPDSAGPEEEEQAGFLAAGCAGVPGFLRDALSDDDGPLNDEDRRRHLLEWCTSLSVLPCDGLRKRIRLRHYEGADDATLPVTHTCTHEIHLPPYLSRARLEERLLMALDHRWDGFHQE